MRASLAGVAILRLGVWPGLGIVVVVTALAAGGAVVAFARGVWLPMVEPALALAVAAFARRLLPGTSSKGARSGR